MSNNEIPFWLRSGTLILQEYYRYTSSVQERLIEVEWDDKSPEANRSRQWFELFREKLEQHDYDYSERQNMSLIGKCQRDNKIAIKCLTPTGAIIYIGYYDNSWSIGLSVYSDSWVKPYKIL